MPTATAGTVNGSPIATPALGRTVPRLHTPPLVVGPAGPCGCGCALTDATSYGFAVVEWSTDVLYYPPDPWERWALIHGLEVLPDGRPRFRTLLLEVARQNGKTTLLVILALWWQFVCDVDLILGTSTKLDYAKESWHRGVKIAEAAPALAVQRGRRWTREANGEQESWTTEGARYKIAPSNAEGGRSLTVHRLILDELRQHHDYSAWDASVNAGNAVTDFQVWGITNAGDDRSVVLNELHDACESFIDWAGTVGGGRVLELAGDAPGDYRTGMFSWSCTPEMDPTNLEHLAYANPNLGHRLDPDALLGAARRAVAAGGAALVGFQTEAMCIRVRSLNLAVDLGVWARTCLVPGTLEDYRGRLAACLDVAPDLQHASLVVAAQMPDGRTRVEVVASWTELAAARRELPAWLEQVRPYTFGWFPGTAAEALNAELGERKTGPRRGWPPRGVRVAPITGETAAAVMSFSALITEGAVIHSGQELLTAHLGNAERRDRGPLGAWIFDRRPGAGHITAAYAAAGAVQLARTIPAPTPRARLHVAPA